MQQPPPLNTSILNLPHDVLRTICEWVIEYGAAREARMTCHTLKTFVDTETYRVSIKCLNPSNYDTYTSYMQQAKATLHLACESSSLDIANNLVASLNPAGSDIIRLTYRNTYDMLLPEFSAVFPKLQRLEIFDNHEITTLPILPECVERIDLHNCSSLRSVSSSLVKCIGNIKSFSLKHCPVFDEELLQTVFSKCSKLKKVEIVQSRPVYIDHSGGACFPGLLEYVHLQCTNAFSIKNSFVCSPNISHFHLDLLTVLESSDHPTTKEDVSDLIFQWHNLRYLFLSGVRVRLCKYEEVRHLQQLRSLTLNEETALSLAWIKEQENLEKLSVDVAYQNCKLSDFVSDKTLFLELKRAKIVNNQSANFKNIRHLSLVGCDIDDSTITTANFIRLKQLQIIACTLRHLHVPSSVKKLVCKHNMFLQFIRFPRNNVLKELHISCSSQISSLDTIQLCDHLETLHVSTCYGLSNVQLMLDLPRLKHIYLAHLPNAYFTHFIGRSIEDVRLHHVKLNSLAVFSRCDMLKTLHVYCDNDILHLGGVEACQLLSELKVRCSNIMNHYALTHCKQIKFLGIMAKYIPENVVTWLKSHLPNTFLYIISTKNQDPTIINNDQPYN